MEAGTRKGCDAGTAVMRRPDPVRAALLTAAAAAGPPSCAAMCTAWRMALGDAHTCVIGDAGSAVKCFGQNNQGQLGLGLAGLTSNSKGNNPGEMGDSLPNVDLGTGTFIDIGAGQYHNCVVFANGKVKCWGDNADEQLGLGDGDDRGMTPASMGSGLPFLDLGTGVAVERVSAGWTHTCVLLSDRRVKCWGKNSDGQLGLGDGVSRGDVPSDMGDNLPFVDLGAGHTATMLCSGETHTCAILDNSSIKCWGSNAHGELGLGDTAGRGETSATMGDGLPVVDLGTGRTARFCSAGKDYTCAVLDDWSIKCWGDNLNGQLGLGDSNARGKDSADMGGNLPAVDLNGDTALEVYCGREHTCARISGGSVKCWGDNQDGQLGLGDSNDRGDGGGEMGANLPAADLGPGLKAERLALGYRFSCAVFDRGAMKCWGKGYSGQIGTGNNADYGASSSTIGTNLPVVDLGTCQPSVAPTPVPFSPPTAPPSAAPSLAPTAPPNQPTNPPTAPPTAAPSGAPSVPPTAAPSKEPSAPPSASPSTSPSAAPSGLPTLVPTQAPSALPTRAPSSPPSVLPTAAPTQPPMTGPTRSPSTMPTQAPSAPPSPAPSGTPSSPPSAVPSASPTATPSGLPSHTPTQAPSSAPSAAPSGLPSRNPSQAPMTAPSASPSGLPSVPPTAAPSAAPSLGPSTGPSSLPTGLPSGAPSAAPAAGPSTAPSWSPTGQPWPIPTAVPSGSPTRLPSGTPSLPPTAAPSAAPSRLPSFAPSRSPSTQPSAEPSSEPTIAPSGLPSLSPVPPTTAPSWGPSPFPSKNPSVPPSVWPTLSPSLRPSLVPTYAPIVSLPSSQPSAAPSLRPSEVPSESPSSEPSVPPSAEPSAPPTGSPRNSPSAAPSEGPSDAPTLSPSATPTKGPTQHPSVSPTGNPSELPTYLPSGSPSVSPVETAYATVQYAQGDARTLRTARRVLVFTIQLSSTPSSGRRALPAAGSSASFSESPEVGVAGPGQDASRSAVVIISDASPTLRKWADLGQGLPAAVAGNTTLTANRSSDKQSLSIVLSGSGYRLRIPNKETLAVQLNSGAFADSRSFEAFCQSGETRCAPLHVTTLRGERPFEIPQSAQEVMDQGEVAAVATASVATLMGAVVGTGVSPSNVARMGLVQTTADCPPDSEGEPEDFPVSVNPLQFGFGEENVTVRFARGTVVGADLITGVCLAGVLLGLARAVRGHQRYRIAAAKQNIDVGPCLMRVSLIHARFPWLLIPTSALYGGALSAAAMMLAVPDEVKYSALAATCILTFGVGFTVYVAYHAKQATGFAEFKVNPGEETKIAKRFLSPSWWIWGRHSWVPIPGNPATYEKISLHHLIFDGYRGGYLRYTFAFEQVYTIALAVVASWTPGDLDGCERQAIILSIIPFVWGVLVGGLCPYIAPYENLLDALIAFLESGMVMITSDAFFSAPDSWHESAAGLLGMLANWTVTAKLIIDLAIFFHGEYRLYKEHRGGQLSVAEFLAWFICFQGGIVTHCENRCFVCIDSLSRRMPDEQEMPLREAQASDGTGSEAGSAPAAGGWTPLVQFDEWVQSDDTERLAARRHLAARIARPAPASPVRDSAGGAGDSELPQGDDYAARIMARIQEREHAARQRYRATTTPGRKGLLEFVDLPDRDDSTGSSASTPAQELPPPGSREQYFGMPHRLAVGPSAGRGRSPAWPLTPQHPAAPSRRTLSEGPASPLLVADNRNRFRHTALERRQAALGTGNQDKLASSSSSSPRALQERRAGRGLASSGRVRTSSAQLSATSRPGAGPPLDLTRPPTAGRGLQRVASPGGGVPTRVATSGQLPQPRQRRRDAPTPDQCAVLRRSTAFNASGLLQSPSSF
eukprot:TRINITY_DN10016_c0_g1_i1.p1 TRINITY_DN10016_c0_g1~~TRINITY_DN10016_c0_g1_i1.p1  ORF type:complete len:1858 (+),score=146.19 TRINITY_DN10016_c0_g1_i1:47-5620(+)